MDLNTQLIGNIYMLFVINPVNNWWMLHYIWLLCLFGTMSCWQVTMEGKLLSLAHSLRVSVVYPYSVNNPYSTTKNMLQYKTKLCYSSESKFAYTRKKWEY